MLPASKLNRLPKVWGPHCYLGRPSLCDPNLQSLLLSLRRSSARHSLRLLKTNPRPARPMKEPSVPALPPARKRKRVRPQGRPRAAGTTKAARRIHRIKTTLVPGPIPWLLRKAVADTDIVFGGGCTLREQGPRRNPGPLPFYGCEFASSEQSLPPRLTHARNGQHPRVPSHIRRTREAVIAIPSTSRMSAMGHYRKSVLQPGSESGLPLKADMRRLWNTCPRTSKRQGRQQPSSQSLAASHPPRSARS
jgi:hypothetical protein